MKNLDGKDKGFDKDAQINAMAEAFESSDPKEVAEKIVNNFETNFNSIQTLMQETIKDAKLANDENWNDQVLASRGVRVLTTEEKKFYNAAIDVESFDEVLELMPPTVFERVFEDLHKEHPLISAVNFQRTGATTAWVLRKEGATHAFWGDVTATIQEMVDSGFHTVEMGMYKLSGFLVVSKAMFELGPRWLDRYVRAVILEVIADELENVIVKGTGVKQPIGMIKNLESSLHPTNGYEDKEAIVLADFSPKTIGKQILAPTTKNGTRRYTGVTLIVNPLDYAEKFFAIGAKQKDDGTWTFNNFAVPGLSIIQSFAVPLNKMIAGKPKNYFMGVGVSAKLETTDILRMIEDQRLYLTRQLVNGRPLDADSFTVYEISAFGDVIPGVEG
ncbi:capsid protein [Alkalihalobacillus pseudalcaliphilus]|nr:capsid protein [Alkalihalobacillus pseudalcaliphilus]